MGDEKNSEEQGKGFVVKDKRFSAKKEEEESPRLKGRRRWRGS